MNTPGQVRLRQEVDMLIPTLLAVLAGVTTTVAGLGGGQLLLLGLALVWSPLEALTVTAPALLIGNLHRAVVFRSALERRRMAPYAVGAFIGAVAGGSWATAIPQHWLLRLILASTLLAVAKHLWASAPDLPSGLLLPGGTLVGLIAATGGGGGTVAGPLLRGVGTTGDRYLAAMATGAVALHVGRLLGYGGQGALKGTDLLLGAVLGVALMVGNLVGLALRHRLSDRQQRRSEVLALCGAAILALSAAG